MSRISKGNSAVTIGTFDGVHLGHQRILEQLDEVAAGEHLERIAYSFVFPPRLAAGKGAQGLLLPEWAKVSLLERYVQRVARVSFQDVAYVPAKKFVQNVLLEDLGARAIVVGKDFRFGQGRAGDASLLRELCDSKGTAVIVVPPVVIDGVPVSSTRIRWLVSKGKVEEAARLLGRPPIILGQVVHGDRLGGVLGYPTANLTIGDGILPPGDGIYLVRVFWSGDKSPGLLYAGKRPSVDGRTQRLEVHLLTPESDPARYEASFQDLYGATLEVHVLQRIRDDRYFSTLSELSRQMGLDVVHARQLLSGSKWPEETIIA
jgi:riboflavin kinase / FMN adenylyltransferase